MAAPSRTFEDIIKAEPSCVQGEPVVVFSSWGAAFQISAIRSNQINLAVHLDERVLHRKRSPVPSTTGVSPPRPRTTVPLDGPSAIPSHLTNEFVPSPAWLTREWPGILPPTISAPPQDFVRTLAVPVFVASNPMLANSVPRSIPTPPQRISETTVVAPLLESTAQRACSFGPDNRSGSSAPCWPPGAEPSAILVDVPAAVPAALGVLLSLPVASSDSPWGAPARKPARLRFAIGHSELLPLPAGEGLPALPPTASEHPVFP